MNYDEGNSSRRASNRFLWFILTIVVGILASLSYRYPQLTELQTRSVWEQLKLIVDKSSRDKPVPSSIYDDVFTWPNEYPLCGSLERQSPINYNLTAGSMESDFISRTTGVELDLVFDERSEWASVPIHSSVNQFLGNFHLILGQQLSDTSASDDRPSQPLGFSYRGYRYNVVHLQIKTPSEHHFDSKYYPVELQIFAKSQSDSHDLIALGVMAELSEVEETTAVENILHLLTLKHGDSGIVDLQPLIGLFFGELLTYSGSLTSPPCTENVIWIHAIQRLFMSARQWKHVREIIGFNARPTQPRSCNTETHDSCQKSMLHSGKSWRFEGNNGLEQWAKQYKTCGSGIEQSPIDLVRTMNVQHVAHHQLVESANFPNPIGWNSIRDARIMRSSYSVSIDLMASVDGISRTCFDDLSNCMPPYYPVTEIDGHLNVLVNIHYHTPSEHRSNGFYYPIELHVVHKHAETAERLVIAFMIEVQTSDHHDNEHMESIFFRSVSKFVKANQRETRHDFDLSLLAKHLKNNGLKTYQGSLTMPPCTEGVRWYVVDGTLQITLKQFQSIAIAHNSRPPISRP